MTSLVTGGNGFIGHQLVRALAERGEDVVVFDAQDRADLLDPLGDRVTFVQGDLAELSEVCTIVEHHRPQTIFHLGALISLAAEIAPQRAFRVNLGGTFNLLEAAKMFDVETLVYASTVAVYGTGVESPVADDAPQFPASVYGATKVASERWAEQHHRLYGTNVRGIRLPTVTGPTRQAVGAGAFGTLIFKEAAFGRPYAIPVTPDTPVAIMYVPDAVRALISLSEISNDRLTRRFYNVAGIAPTVGDIVSAVRQVIPEAELSYRLDEKIQVIVESWPILSQAGAEHDWGWHGGFTLDELVRDFVETARRSGS